MRSGLSKPVSVNTALGMWDQARARTRAGDRNEGWWFSRGKRGSTRVATEVVKKTEQFQRRSEDGNLVDGGGEGKVPTEIPHSRSGPHQNKSPNRAWRDPVTGSRRSSLVRISHSNMIRLFTGKA